MADGFYAQGLEERGLGVTLPNQEQQDIIHRIIYDELIAGVVSAAAVQAFQEICGTLVTQGARAVLLACTELELLTRGHALPYATLDSAAIHAEAAWCRATSSKRTLACD